MQRWILTFVMLSVGLIEPVEAQFTVMRSVVGNGGATIEEGRLLTHGTVGQAAVGRLENGRVLHMVGFWYVPEAAIESVHDVGNYSVLATNSIWIRQRGRIRSGFVGVNKISDGPFMTQGTELVLGVLARTDEGVEVSAPDARLLAKAKVAGTLNYLHTLKVGKEAKVGNPVQVGADFWPLVALPDFVTGTPGSENVTVKQNKTKVLPPGAYGDIVVKKKGRLILTGGRYAIRSLRAGQQSKVWFEGESRVLVDERLRTDSRSYFGPRQYSGVDASEILVYVNGKNGENGKLKSSPKAAQVGIQAQFLANLYAPNGTLWLRQRSRSEGAFIGRDVRVGIRADVRINSSWSAPSGTPSPKPVLAKPTLPAETESEDSNLAFGLDQNYPNPFNPSTTIRYTLAEESTVRLVVYNVLGQEVRVLVDKTLAEGAYDVAWDGKDTIGRAVSSGVYMYLLEATSQVVVRKMVFAK